jgi:hypothetical protein
MSRRSLLPPVAPSGRQRSLALTQFGDLLQSDTTERDWQRFFDENPFVLSESLPIHYDALYSQVPLLSGIPDYVFRAESGTPGLGDWGVIELKRPDDALVGVYSSKILTPSRKLVTAHQQTKQYLRAIEQGQFLNPEDFFVAGNRKHAFIIIGLSKEIRKKCHTHELQDGFRDLVPMGFHVFTYDELCERFAERVGPPLVVLMARPERLTILLVSEDTLTPHSFGRIFRRVRGWEAIKVTRGQDVVPSCLGHPGGVDAIVLHHNYVSNIGHLVTEIMEAEVDAPVIVMNTNMNDNRDRLLAAGVRRWIELPCRPTEVCDEIAAVVRAHRKVRP